MSWVPLFGLFGVGKAIESKENPYLPKQYKRELDANKVKPEWSKRTCPNYIKISDLQLNDVFMIEGYENPLVLTGKDVGKLSVYDLGVDTKLNDVGLSEIWSYSEELKVKFIGRPYP